VTDRAAERVVIDRVGHQGDGVAKTPAGPVFVPYTLPGETAAVEKMGERAKLIEVVTASSERIAAICPYFGTCGGCALQHWQEKFYRQWKRDLIVAALDYEVIRAEIKKAAVKRETSVPILDKPVVALDQLKTAEKGLIWALMHNPTSGLGAVGELDPQDLEGLSTRWILEQARSLQEWPAGAIPQTLLERLNEMEARIVQDIGRQPHPPGEPHDCVRALKRLRYTRERADVQREIDRLQRDGGANHEREIVALWDQKMALLQRIESLNC